MSPNAARLEPYQKIFAGLYILFGAYFMYSAFSVALSRVQTELTGTSAYFVVLAAFFVLCGVSYAKRWRFHRTLVGIAGGLLVLYAASLVMFGTEDVGGRAVSISIGILPLAMGLWSIVLAVTEQP